MPTQVILQLDGCCLETAARREYRRLCRSLLGGDETPGDTPAQLALVTDFLSSCDFALLRAENPAIDGATRCAVRLERNPTGDPVWTLESGQRPGEDQR